MSGESSDVTVASSPQELLDVVELRDVVYYEVSGKRCDAEGDSESHPLAINVMFRIEEKELGVRFQSNVTAFGGTYVADAEVIFALAKRVDIKVEAMQGFVERVAMMVVYPYLREAIADSATRLSLQRPIPSLLRGLQVHLYREDASRDEEGAED
jgi:hypothetical protein